MSLEQARWKLHEAIAKQDAQAQVKAIEDLMRIIFAEMLIACLPEPRF